MLILILRFRYEIDRKPPVSSMEKETDAYMRWAKVRKAIAAEAAAAAAGHAGGADGLRG